MTAADPHANIRAAMNVAAYRYPINTIAIMLNLWHRRN